jgi:hypothetical protein
VREKKLPSMGSLGHPQEKGSEGGFGCPLELGPSRGSAGVRFFAPGPYFLSWGSSRGSIGVALSSSTPFSWSLYWHH